MLINILGQQIEIILEIPAGTQPEKINLGPELESEILNIVKQYLSKTQEDIKITVLPEPEFCGKLEYKNFRMKTMSQIELYFLPQLAEGMYYKNLLFPGDLQEYKHIKENILL